MSEAPFIGVVEWNGASYGLCYGDSLKEVASELHASINTLEGKKGTARLFIGPTDLWESRTAVDNNGSDGYLQKTYNQ